MSKGRILNQKSIFTAEAVGGTAETYSLKMSAVVAGKPLERVRAPLKRWVGLYLDYFKEGFRIPVSPFLVEVLKYYKIHVSKLIPNAISHK